jgi:hypothetical protein
MLQRLTDLPPGIDGVKASGKVSKHDYDEVMEPLINAARCEGRRLRLLYEIGPDFHGFTGGAAWEDAKLGLSNLRLFEGVAVVTNVGWIIQSTRLATFVMPCPVKTFDLTDRGAAIQWLGTLSERATVGQRIVAERGVLVVDVTQALRSADFEAIAATADTWIEAHGGLHGLVIHVRAFPGWENLGALVRHVRFVRDHHKKISRIALAADSKLASVGPRIAEHFIKAEVKVFGYDDLEAAIVWAGGPAKTSAVSTPNAA